MSFDVAAAREIARSLYSAHLVRRGPLLLAACDEIERLRNKLDTDSQNFQILCQKAEIERHRKLNVALGVENERLRERQIPEHWTETFTAYEAEIERLREALANETGRADAQAELTANLTEEVTRLREALNGAKSDLLWQAGYAERDGRNEAFEAIARIDAALEGSRGR